MKNVDIFGTCFTRELFNTTTDYEVNTYLMQQSIFTMFSDPLYIDTHYIKSYDNYAFKNRMIYYEFYKVAMQKLLENPAEYLIIDLLDMGRDILNFNIPSGVKLISTRDVLCTLNNIKSSNSSYTIDYNTINICSYGEEKIKNILNKFIQLLFAKYDKDNIILNKAQMQNTYYENNIKKTIVDSFIYSRLDFIKKVEDIFVQLFPDVKILFSNYEPILDINHRFGGPHPVHFEQIYYEYRMCLLDSLIKNEDIQKVNNNYEKKYTSEIEKIKEKKLIR